MMLSRTLLSCLLSQRAIGKCRHTAGQSHSGGDADVHSRDEEPCEGVPGHQEGQGGPGAGAARAHQLPQREDWQRPRPWHLRWLPCSCRLQKRPLAKLEAQAQVALPLAQLAVAICGSVKSGNALEGCISGHHIPTAVTPGCSLASGIASSLVAS